MSTRVLVLREYESARIGERWDAAERVISTRIANAIEQIATNRDQFLAEARAAAQAAG